ncbi:MAG: sigma-70 family RNA polymerase sigma factor, partial [Opitutaceae bacterium]|nr:sigma-70 family RNA polymerase sigma factor [Opitutaceae bacterium]
MALSEKAQPEDHDSAERESDLLAQARKGDDHAFGELMQRHHGRIFRRVQSIVRNHEDSRDICQEVWFSAWKLLGTYRGESRFSTWMFTLATRRAIDHVRKRQRWYNRFLPYGSGKKESGSPDESEIPTPTPDPGQQAEENDRASRLEEAMNALPAVPRAVLAMREIEGLSYAEISATLNCPVGTVMSRLHHARRLLLKQLKDLPCD